MVGIAAPVPGMATKNLTVTRWIQNNDTRNALFVNKHVSEQ